jgi:hypothetical protein
MGWAGGVARPWTGGADPELKGERLASGSNPKKYRDLRGPVKDHRLGKPMFPALAGPFRRRTLFGL